jgi:hypothetical protein
LRIGGVVALDDKVLKPKLAGGNQTSLGKGF